MVKTKYLVVILAVIVATVVIVTLAWPIRGQRNKAVDAQISADLEEVSSKVSEKYYSSRSVPASLSEITLTDSLKKRNDKNGVKYNKKSASAYELCANFKTDTTKESGGSDQPEMMRSGASSSYADVTNHKAGNVCFDFNLSSYYYGEDRQSSSDLENLINEAQADLEGSQETYRNDFSIPGLLQSLSN